MKNKKLKRRQRIKNRVRSKIIRKSKHPRLSVHKSNNYIYAQVIDDFDMKTLVSANDMKLKGKKMTHTERAEAVGKDLAAKMKKKKITQVVFDRGPFPYQGRVKALGDAVRDAGITI